MLSILIRNADQKPTVQTMVSKGENHLKLVEETNRLSVHKRGQVVLRFGKFPIKY